MNECSCRNEDMIQTYYRNYYETVRVMIAEMMAVAPESSISAMFIRQMIPHHRGAILMSRSILEASSDPCIISIAERIITEQLKSIADMERIIAACESCTNSEDAVWEYQAQFQKITAVMAEHMSCAPAPRQLNRAFLYEMIPHHEGAVRMSLLVRKFPICPGLTDITDSIIRSQRQGIQQMQCVLS